MGHGQTPYEGILEGYIEVLVKGLLGGILGVLTRPHMGMALLPRLPSCILFFVAYFFFFSFLSSYYIVMKPKQYILFPQEYDAIRVPVLWQHGFGSHSPFINSPRPILGTVVQANWQIMHIRTRTHMLLPTKAHL